MNLFRKMVYTVMRPFTLVDRSVPGRGESSTAGEAVNFDSVMALSTVWACVNLVAGTIAALPIDVQRRKGKSVEPVEDHPLVRVLVAESLYRAWSITTNHPYHRE